MKYFYFETFYPYHTKLFDYEDDQIDDMYKWCTENFGDIGPYSTWQFDRPARRRKIRRFIFQNQEDLAAFVLTWV